MHCTRYTEGDANSPTMDSQRKNQPYRALPEEDPGEEVAIATFGAPHEAHLAVLHLERQGIAAHVTNDLVVGMAPHLGSGMAGVRVMVRERDAIEAHEHLEQLRIEVRKEQALRKLEPDEAGSTKPTSGRHFFFGVSALFLALLAWVILNTLR